ncbi:DUF4258 domain-containing protein [Patescibacteria group bacterium]|nr:DUF4258 domain-containing protein [Patescibacteria group bacterium]
MELGEASMHVDPVFSKAIDHPYITGAVTGIVGGLAALTGGYLLGQGGLVLTSKIIPASITISTQSNKLNKIVDFTSRYGSNLGSKMNQIGNILSNKGYQFYDHAIKRMAERNIDTSSVLNTIQNSKPFEYLHNGAMKYGYYDSASKIFVGRLQSTKEITTVINNVTTKYINNLIKTIQ